MKKLRAFECLFTSIKQQAMHFHHRSQILNFGVPGQLFYVTQHWMLPLFNVVPAFVKALQNSAF